MKNPSKFWDFFCKNRAKNDIPKSVTLNGVTSSSKLEAINLFGSHFSLIYSRSFVNTDFPGLSFPCFDLLNICCFEHNDVFLKI